MNFLYPPDIRITLGHIWLSKTDLEGGRGAHVLPIFCNHFEELQTELFEGELIINNASLTYVYPNTTKHI